MNKHDTEKEIGDLSEIINLAVKLNHPAVRNAIMNQANGYRMNLRIQLEEMIIEEDIRDGTFRNNME